MSTNSTGNRLYFYNCEHEPWQCHKHSKTFLRGRIGKTNCVFENTPPPHFGLDVVCKIGGGGGGGGGGCSVLTGHYGTCIAFCVLLFRAFAFGYELL